MRNAGITVRGTYQEDDSFHMDYYYPYVFGTSITTNEQIDVEKHAEKESMQEYVTRLILELH